MPYSPGLQAVLLEWLPNLTIVNILGLELQSCHVCTCQLTIYVVAFFGVWPKERQLMCYQIIHRASQGEVLKERPCSTQFSGVERSSLISTMMTSCGLVWFTCLSSSRTWSCRSETTQFFVISFVWGLQIGQASINIYIRQLKQSTILPP